MREQLKRIEEMEKRQKIEKENLLLKMNSAIEARARDSAALREACEAFGKRAESLGYEFTFKLTLKNEDDSMQPSPLSKFGRTTQKTAALEILNMRLSHCSGKFMKPIELFNEDAQRHWREVLDHEEKNITFDLKKQRGYFSRALWDLSNENHVEHQIDGCKYSVKRLPGLGFWKKCMEPVHVELTKTTQSQPVSPKSTKTETIGPAQEDKGDSATSVSSQCNLCSIDGCNNGAQRGGVCTKHEPEEEIEVVCIVINGINYLHDENSGDIYCPETQDAIGMYKDGKLYNLDEEEIEAEAEEVLGPDGAFYWKTPDGDVYDEDSDLVGKMVDGEVVLN